MQEQDQTQKHSLVVPFLVVLLFLLLGGILFLLVTQKQPEQAAQDNSIVTTEVENGQDTPADDSTGALPEAEEPKDAVPAEDDTTSVTNPTETTEEKPDRTGDIDEHISSLDELDLSTPENDLGDDKLSDL